MWKYTGAAALFTTAMVGVPALYGQGANDVRTLKAQIEALQTGQKEIQKNLQIVKDILLGKQPPLEDVYISTKGAASQGDSRAKVVMVEFSDFQCPYCSRYAGDAYSQILDKYVKPGKVRYVARSFPLEQIHANAEKAAEAAECAGEQGKYWEMHDRLFRNQNLLDPKEMPGHALVLGLDQEKFKQCLDGGKFASRVKADVVDGAKLRVSGTPTFFFGYQDERDPEKIKAVKLLTGAQQTNAFVDVLDSLLNNPGKGNE